jgi:hypothetical protein
MVVKSRLWVLTVALALTSSRAGSTVRSAHPAAVAGGDRDAMLRIYRDQGDLILDLGPIDLPAHAMHDAIRQPPPLAVRVPADGWMRGYSVDVFDSTGALVPHTVIHHLNVIAPERRELFSQIMLRVAAAGSETRAVELPPFIGYRLHAGDSLLVSSMLHNPTGRAYPAAHLKVRLKFSEASWWRHPLDVYPFYLDVMPPAGGHSFDLPPGRSERSWEGRPAVAGRILAVGGHLHKYGVSLRLEDRTADRVLWEVKPDTTATGDIASIPVKKFLWTMGVRIYPDHVYRLVADYDNPTGATIPDGGMGALGGVIWPMASQAWPPVNRADPQYQYDVSFSWRRIAAANEHMHMSMP